MAKRRRRRQRRKETRESVVNINLHLTPIVAAPVPVIPSPERSSDDLKNSVEKTNDQSAGLPVENSADKSLRRLKTPPLSLKF